MVQIGKLKQIRDMRRQAKDMKSTLSEEVVVGNSLGNKVQVTMDGNQDLTGVNIDPEILSPDNKEKVESAIKQAFADAGKQLKKKMSEKLRSGELEMPDMSSFKKK
ncbi:YbaB/EbfC family nucleoid-associated protein [Patescibacteria group bacterium]